MDRRRFLKSAIGGSLVIGATPLTTLVQSVAAQNPYDHFLVATDALNGRSGPGLGYDVVAVYTEGERLEVSPELIEYADGYTWRAVNVKPGPVWVAEEYLNPVSDGEPQTGTLQVIDGPLNMRGSAGLSGAVLTALPTGAIVWVDSGAGIVTADGYTWAAGWASDADSTWGWVGLEFCQYI